MKLFRSLRSFALALVLLAGPGTLAVFVGSGVVATQGCAGKTNARLAYDTLDGATSTVQAAVRAFGILRRQGYGTDAQEATVRAAYAAFQKGALAASYVAEMATTDTDRESAKAQMRAATTTALQTIEAATAEAKALPPPGGTK